jgi:hypothetical protein
MDNKDHAYVTIRATPKQSCKKVSLAFISGWSKPKTYDRKRGSLCENALNFGVFLL